MSRTGRAGRRLLVATALTGAAALAGYGRRAYGACVNVGGTNFQCTGANAAQQSISLNDANTYTAAGFSVNTGAGRGVTITGNGALTFTDSNSSVIKSTNSHGLYMYSPADNGGTPSSVTVTTNAGSHITGTFVGAGLYTYGSGATLITLNGDVTATGGMALLAVGRGSNMTITSGASGNINGTSYGIRSINTNGPAVINISGDVNASAGTGIHARSYGTSTSLTISTYAGSTVSGSLTGISATNDGSTDLLISAAGNVTGTGNYGILARNNNTAQNLTITTGATSTISSNASGIVARNYGTKALSISANGDVTGTGTWGIYAYNANSGTNLSITTGAGGTVTGSTNGIIGGNTGSGSFTVTANGDVVSTAGSAIYAFNSGTSLTISTGANAAITASTFGLEVNHTGSGALTINNDGDIDAGNTGIRVTAGAVTINNTGLIDGATKSLSLAGANDTLKLNTGSNLVSAGGADMGGGTDTVILLGSGSENETFLNTEILNMNGTAWTLTTTSSFNDIDVTTGVLTNDGALTVANNLAVASGATYQGAGTLAGDLDIALGGLWAGTGKVTGDVTNNGTVGPGNSVGTQTITGNFVQGAGGTLQIEFDNTGIDLLDISGTANIAGTLELIELAPGVSIDTPLTFLKAAGGITGTFSPVTELFLAGTSITEADVAIGATEATVTFSDFVSDFAGSGTTAAEQSVGAALDYAATADAANALAIINALRAEPDIANALASSSGTTLNNTTQGVAQSLFFATDLALGEQSAGGGIRIAGLSGLSAGNSLQSPESGLWIHALKGFGEVDSDRTARGGDYDLNGVAFGAHRAIDDRRTLGFFGAFSNIATDTEGLNDKAEADVYQAGLTGRWQNGRWLCEGMTSGAYFDVHTYRPLGQGTAQGDFSGWGAAASVKSVFELLIRDDLKISPYAEIKASHVETGSYAESGAGALNMHYEDTETDKLVTAFGVQVDTPPLPVGRSLSIQPALHAAMAYNFLDQAGRADARFTGSAATVFTGEGPERDRASALVGMRFDIQPADTTDIGGYVNYDTEQARDAEHHALMVGLRVRW